ncbi:MAG: 3-deoxy-7-phosphoheptulonate synthase [Candidatus Micrarchaeota archaeon]|nr:3-deoxy-7-phosphoheptulonate synthase [Candidatus Micrarchaeota archaeon]
MFTVIAGPCSVESYEQTLEVAKAVKEAGAHMLRGGAFKPRTNPRSFQGLGKKGLEILAEVGKEVGLPVVTEVMDPRDVELVSQYADVLQIGTRNMQNFPLLKEVGRQEKPVILKRGMCATIEEWLYAAEYIRLEGNENIILMERGIRTFEKYTRNTLDLSAVLAAKELSSYPVYVDPSHGTGKRSMIEPMAIAAKALGADGLMVEVHPNPEKALSDQKQQITPDEFKRLMEKLKKVPHYSEL